VVNLTRRYTIGCAAALLSIAALPQLARAVPEFPREIQRDLSLDYEPPCYLCHVKDKTGIGTAQTPFALSMRANGLDANDRTSLTTALNALEQAQIDSDGDGVDDVAELKADTDPNSDSPGSLSERPGPIWGCSAAAVNARSDGFACWSVMLWSAAGFVRARTRRRTQPKLESTGT
jgi:hypothetical protein